MPPAIIEDTVEQAAIEWLTDLGYTYIHGPDITPHRNATIDWSVQESARAKIWVAVKHLLRQYGYPPDLQAAATRTVVQQAELLATESSW